MNKTPNNYTNFSLHVRIIVRGYLVENTYVPALYTAIKIIDNIQVFDQQKSELFCEPL